jgi:hypothetical protein
MNSLLRSERNAYHPHGAMQDKAGELSNCHALVVGTVRNVAHHLDAEIGRIRSAFSRFGGLSWFLVESDSSDATLAELQRLSQGISGFRFVSLGNLRETMPKRTARLAHCRNAYLQTIRSDPAYRDVDYVVMVDLDGVCDLLTAEGVMSCWDRSDWDVCTANQRGPYYDIWALRHESWCPGDCWQQNAFLARRGLEPASALFASVYSRMLVIPESADWIEVDSAFGGLAIYRRAALQAGNYVGLTDSGEEQCDHPTLHATLRASGLRLFINPKLINTGYTEHSEPVRGMLWRAAASARFRRVFSRAAVKRLLGPTATRGLRRLLRKHQR